MTDHRRWLALVLSLIVAFGGGLFVTLMIVSSNERRAQRDVCELVEVYDAAYRADPPTTETGRRIAEQTRRYLQRNC